MKRRDSIRAIVLLGLVLASLAWLVAAEVSPQDLKRMFGPGTTPKETASILVHDEKFGGRAQKKAVEYGDEILPWLVRESQDFALLNGRNSLWIAEVLGSIQTEQSRAILLDLYSREDKLARLTGAVGLAQQGALPDEIGEDSFLVKAVRSDPSQAESHLAIIALGRSKSKRALSCLLALLEKRGVGYWYHAYACEAVARIDSPRAIPVLRACMQSEDFHAVPQAFRALVSLGEREAVPLMIARVIPKDLKNSSISIVRELEFVTGQSLGFERDAWQQWWERVEATWEIPEKFRKPWDEQPKAR